MDLPTLWEPKRYLFFMGQQYLCSTSSIRLTGCLFLVILAISTLKVQWKRLQTKNLLFNVNWMDTAWPAAHNHPLFPISWMNQRFFSCQPVEGMLDQVCIVQASLVLYWMLWQRRPKSSCASNPWQRPMGRNVMTNVFQWDHSCIDWMRTKKSYQFCERSRIYVLKWSSCFHKVA